MTTGNWCQYRWPSVNNLRFRSGCIRIMLPFQHHIFPRVANQTSHHTVGQTLKWQIKPNFSVDVFRHASIHSAFVVKETADRFGALAKSNCRKNLRFLPILRPDVLLQFQHAEEVPKS
ncbi:hypothetical protein GCK72_021966 [Caenorhabditis remanei]|uniref:Uncharacterized protein n=1 Tax=Caenorhabditis remanei TaxID=31234 RepID=A0A6A5GJE0_CAERE|nr:hypothetical protein GCK72_021966 [Caenorhabditis remanei]KAF1755397.1 hypothetical protein GCK72_021966 [Caenorhabditis remanei]